LAASVDFILALDRERHHNEAILSVTGRDIIESEYALIAEDGWLWQLDGDSLDAAAAHADERRDQATESAKLEKLGRRSREVVQFVNQRDRVTPANVSTRFGMAAKVASNQLNRLADEGHLVKAARGEYHSKRYTALNESGESDGIQ
jgi:ribosomal protein S25